MMANQVHDNHWRFENKYRISKDSYHAIRNALTPHMRPDVYTSLSGRDGYFVRSLYFETFHHFIYAQKMAGDSDRVKYRLRSYSADAGSCSKVRVEMKVRRGESLSKYHTFVDYAQYTRFMETRDWGGAMDDTLEEFSRGMYLFCLRPSVLVDYEREGYESRYRDGVRVTFDHAVRSTHANTLFPDPLPFSRVHHSGEIVLEIKYQVAPPLWLRDIVQRYGLRLVANSKFTQGIEVGRRERYYPSGVIIVR